MKRILSATLFLSVFLCAGRLAAQEPAAYAMLLVTTDLDVKITVNGGKEYLALAGDAVIRIPLERGENIVKIKPSDGGADGYTEIVKVDKPENKVLVIELAEKRKIAAESASARKAVINKQIEDKRKAEEERLAAQKRSEAERLKKRKQENIKNWKENNGTYIDIGGMYPTLTYGIRQRFGDVLSFGIGGSRSFTHQPLLRDDRYDYRGERHSAKSFSLGVYASEYDLSSFLFGAQLNFYHFKIQHNYPYVNNSFGDVSYSNGEDYSYKGTVLSLPIGYQYLGEKAGFSAVYWWGFYIKKPYGIDIDERYGNNYAPVSIRLNFFIRVF